MKPHPHPLPRPKNEDTESAGTTWGTPGVFETKNDNNSLNMKCYSQKRNVFKWTENHFGAIPSVRDGSETAVFLFDCALEPVYFVIVLQLHQIQKTLFTELSELLCYFLWAFYMNHLPRYRKREWRLKSWVAVTRFHISSCGIAFKSITSLPLSSLQYFNISVKCIVKCMYGDWMWRQLGLGIQGVLLFSLAIIYSIPVVSA